MKKPLINNFDKKFIQEVKNACSASKPYVLFARPEDASAIKQLFPRIESDVYIVPYLGVEKGEARAIERKILKDWADSHEEFDELAVDEMECEYWNI